MGTNKLLVHRQDKKQTSESSSETIIEDAPVRVIPITPIMLRKAVKVLQLRRFHVSSALIENYLRRSYPVETNPKALKAELQDKLKYAVCVGLISQDGHDKYSLPTIRQEAATIKTAISVFWEMYYNDKKFGKRDRRVNILPHILKKKKLSKYGNR